MDLKLAIFKPMLKLAMERAGHGAALGFELTKVGRGEIEMTFPLQSRSGGQSDYWGCSWRRDCEPARHLLRLSGNHYADQGGHYADHGFTPRLYASGGATSAHLCIGQGVSQYL